jgi:hypothetical protein
MSNKNSINVQDSSDTKSENVPLLLSVINRFFLPSNSYLNTARIAQSLDILLGDEEPLTSHQINRDIRDYIGLVNMVDSEEHINQRLPKSPIPIQFNSLPNDCITKLLVQSPSRFYSITRLLPLEYWTIYTELKEAIETPRNQPVSAENTTRSRPINAKRKLHSIDELLIWILHSDGGDSDTIGVFFDGIHRTTIDRIADHVTSCINRVYLSEIAWPDAEERAACYGLLSLHDKAIGLCDGTHCMIDVPIDIEDENSYYSGYKKGHTQSYLIWVNVLGFIIKVAGPFPGRLSDRGTYNTTDIADPKNGLLTSGEYIIADGGLQGEGQFLLPIRITDIKKSEEEKKLDMIDYNQEVGDNRSLVEHCIHVIKSRAQVLQKRYSRGRAKQSDLFYASAKLVNRIKRYRYSNVFEEQL